MSTRVYGSCNEFPIEFERRKESDQEIWDAIVPASSNGTYVCEIWVESSSGMSSYAATVMFIISGHKIRGTLVQRGYDAENNTIQFDSLLDFSQIIGQIFARCYESERIC